MSLIYLAQLTHESTVYQNRCFPLAVGYIGAMLLERGYEVELFKSPRKLNEKLMEQLPDYMMFSCYMWNTGLTSEFCTRLLDMGVTIVAGGPNVKGLPTTVKHHPKSAIVYGDGEARAMQIVGGGKLQPITNLDDISSPYLSGLFDSFFEAGEVPLLETNRRCPFRCTFCQQGLGSNKIEYFSVERFRAEMEYIADRATGMQEIEIADPNFGMFNRDPELTAIIREFQESHNFPLKVRCSTGKNRTEKIIESIRKLKPDTMPVRIAIQSMHEPTLKAIERDNIKTDTYMYLASIGLAGNADVMLGLPLETRNLHFAGIYELIDKGVDEFSLLQTSLLHDTKLKDPEYRIKYGIVGRHRPIPECHGTYNILGEQVESSEQEEIIIGNDTLSYQEYLDCRKLHYIVMLYHCTGLLDVLYSLGHKRSLLVSMLYEITLDTPLMDGFVTDTDTEHEQPVGDNILFKHVAIALYKNTDVVAGAIACMLREHGLPEGECTEHAAIARERIILPNEELVDKKFKPIALVGQLGEILELTVDDGQRKVLDLLNTLYSSEEDKITRLVYRLRPKNTTLKCALASGSVAQLVRANDS